MFGKKKCSRCSKKVDKGFDFCPYCSNHFVDRADYGLLGKNDNFRDAENPKFKSAGLADSFLDKIFESAFKVIERQVQKISEEELRHMKNTKPNSLNPGFKLFIYGQQVILQGNIAGFQLEEVNENSNPYIKQKIPKQPKIEAPQVSAETLKNSLNLPRKEAKTKLTRTAERVVYELETPGIYSLNNVLVNQLENSIEVRVYTKKAVYFKTILVKLPLMQYSIKEDKLVLEFKA